MPLPRGTDPEKAVFGYMHALQGFPVEAIAYGIQRFLRGECEGINPRFCPHPPELANIVRGTLADRPRFVGNGTIYRYRMPKSQMLERNCSKDWARGLVRQGVHPHGSIWVPGTIGEKPEIGDLYGPDPDWENAVPLNNESA
jgi:hypothetical protein